MFFLFVVPNEVRNLLTNRCFAVLDMTVLFCKDTKKNQKFAYLQKISYLCSPFLNGEALNEVNLC
jgi:hypothetical protein